SSRSERFPELRFWPGGDPVVFPSHKRVCRNCFRAEGEKSFFVGRLFKNSRTLSCGLALMALLLMAPAHAREPLRVPPGSLEDAPPELIQRLQANPYNYF